ncbi:MAG: hypothetical protein ACKVZH_27360 [Blastocatellia bacterium]
MSATTVTLPIDSELENWLTNNATAQGVKLEQFAVEALRRLARRPSIDEVFAEVQAEFAASGMTDEDLKPIIEHALAEAPNEESAAPIVTSANLDKFIMAMATDSAKAPVLPPSANERAFYYEGQE